MTNQRGKKQLSRQTMIGAPSAFVYRLFMDNSELHNWAPPVDRVVKEMGGDETGLGRTRTCEVTMQGKRGTMAEECVEAVADTRASFHVVEDSFGFGRMFRDYGFTVHFAEIATVTQVRIETFYTPANVVWATMNTLFMRRKFRGIADELLGGLKTLAEQRYTAAA
jgi:Polyketide cyclase / dehydrase and lipid transport